MSWTKQQFISQAFEEIGLATYVFDLQPEQLQAALRRLDGMMATWNAEGIRIGYPLPVSPQDSTLDEVTGVPDAAAEAIYTNLAIRIAPTVGKSVSIETKMAARIAYEALLGKVVYPTELQIAELPYGAGDKMHGGQRFMDEPDDELDVGPDGELELE